MFVSYAQNFEDVMLWRALKHIEKGFYIDIGAQDPVVDSVSLAFYEHGWRGVHVEPVSHYADKLRLARPDEKVIQAAVGSKSGVLSFFEIIDTGLSTGDVQIAEKHRAAGLTVRESDIPCLPLCEILAHYQDREIHWMKIDVEGMEKEVIQGWLPSEVRPWMVVIESTLPNTQVETYDEWEPLLFELGYEFVYFDGLSRFYVSKAHEELKKYYRHPPNVFDNFVLGGTSGVFCVLLNEKIAQHEQKNQSLMDTLAERDRQIGELQTGVERLNNEWYVAKTKIDELNGQVNHWRSVADGLNQELQAVYTSLSWRLTKPLRWGKLYLKKIPGGIKSILLRVAGLPRRFVRHFLNAGLAYVQRNPKCKAYLKRLLARWPQLQGRLYAFAQARHLLVTGASHLPSSIPAGSLDLSGYPVSVRNTYLQLAAVRAWADHSRGKEGRP